MGEVLGLFLVRLRITDICLRASNEEIRAWKSFTM
jgi:hypothetical protein